MAQKVNPIAVRLKFNRNSDSSWFSDYYYATLLYQDFNFRNYFNCIKQPIGNKLGFRVGKCVIHHYPKRSFIHLFCLGSKRKIKHASQQLDAPKYSYDNVIPFVVQSSATQLFTTNNVAAERAGLAPTNNGDCSTTSAPRYYKQKDRFGYYIANSDGTKTAYSPSIQNRYKVATHKNQLGNLSPRPVASSAQRAPLGAEESWSNQKVGQHIVPKTLSKSRRLFAYGDSDKLDWMVTQRSLPCWNQNKAGSVVEGRLEHELPLGAVMTQSRLRSPNNPPKGANGGERPRSARREPAHLFQISAWTSTALKEVLEAKGDKISCRPLRSSSLVQDRMQTSIGQHSKNSVTGTRSDQCGVSQITSNLNKLTVESDHCAEGEHIAMLSSFSEFTNTSLNYFVMQYFFKLKTNSDLTSYWEGSRKDVLSAFTNDALSELEKITNDPMVEATLSSGRLVEAARPEGTTEVLARQNYLRPQGTPGVGAGLPALTSEGGWEFGERSVKTKGARSSGQKCLQLCLVKSRHYYLSNIQTILCNQTNTFSSIIPIKVTSVYQSASLVAQEICYKLEQAKSFRQICRTIFQQIEICNYIKGIRIACSGRLNGAEIAKTECKKYGETSLHVFSDQIDYASTKASTPYGILGVKVWISYL